MSDIEDQGGMADQMKAHHKARTEVPSRPDVDARLDSRSADQLEPPVGSTDPDAAKPQHVDGPDVAGQAEWTAKTLREKAPQAKRAVRPPHHEDKGDEKSGAAKPSPAAKPAS